MLEESWQSLERFYNRYKDALDIASKLRLGSALLSSIEIKKNVRFRALSEAAIPSIKIAPQALKELEKDGHIRETDEASKYAITGKGIWEVEKQKGLIDDKRLIGYLDAKFLDLFEPEGKLSDNDRVILLSLIAARTYSEESAMNLHESNSLDTWKSVIEGSYELLKEMDLVSKEKVELFTVKGNEHPVSSFIRHSDALPRKTKGLFKAPGRQNYYLDLYDGSELSTTKLAHLLSLIFEGEVNVGNIESIMTFCRKVAYSDSMHLFSDLKNHRFASPEYDDSIRDALRG